MPAFAVLAITAPLGFELAGSTHARRAAGYAALAAQLALPLASLPRLLDHAIPTPADRAAGDRFVTFLRSINGDVLIWDQRFVETRPGETSWGLEMAASDILRSSDEAAKANLQADVIAACQGGRFAGIVDAPAWLVEAVRLGPPVALFDNDEVFTPVAGAPRRPPGTTR